MSKQQLTAKQKRLDTDLSIIGLVTLGVFMFYAATGSQLKAFVTNSSISVIPRLLLLAGVQFGIAGLGITIVCILRKEIWGFFAGFNYAVICEKINQRYPSINRWIDYGAITCAFVCMLFHPFSISFWGIIEIITTLIAIYGMLMEKKQTGSAWGCVFAFCFIWNAL